MKSVFGDIRKSRVEKLEHLFQMGPMRHEKQADRLNQVWVDVIDDGELISNALKNAFENHKKEERSQLDFQTV